MPHCSLRVAQNILDSDNRFNLGEKTVGLQIDMRKLRKFFKQPLAIQLYPVVADGVRRIYNLLRLIGLQLLRHSPNITRRVAPYVKSACT
jgi:hypothetical protein